MTPKGLFSGLVYNVTPYMDYHPGGEDELMKAAGIDGTDLFDQVRKVQVYSVSVLVCPSCGDGHREFKQCCYGDAVCAQVHRWVNYESMLKECLVGRMATTTKGKHTQNKRFSFHF